jgi:two-component system, OmpR family, response regulator
VPSRVPLAFLPPAVRVLVVDDRCDAADTLAALLAQLGADARSCYDGPTALAVVDDWRPVAAVLDLHMPGMDGFELAGRLRERVGQAPTILVALTGAGDEENRRRAKEAGFDLFLTKAADLSELQPLIDRLTSLAATV